MTRRLEQEIGAQIRISRGYKAGSEAEIYDAIMAHAIAAYANDLDGNNEVERIGRAQVALCDARADGCWLKPKAVATLKSVAMDYFFDVPGVGETYARPVFDALKRV